MCAIAVGCAFLPVQEQVPHRGAPADLPSQRFAWRPLSVLLVASALAGISYRGNTLVQPGYFAEHVSLVWYGAATSAAYLLGTVGQYVGGSLADRRDARRLYLLFHACSLPALLAMTLLAGVPLVAVAAVFVFFSLGMQPIENSLLAHYTPARWRGTIFGIKATCTFGVGSLAVWMVRWSTETGGLAFSLLCLAGVVLLVVVCAAILAFMPDASPARSAPPVRPADVLGGAVTADRPIHPSPARIDAPIEAGSRS
jgi:MFS family permease